MVYVRAGGAYTQARAGGMGTKGALPFYPPDRHDGALVVAGPSGALGGSYVRDNAHSGRLVHSGEMGGTLVDDGVVIGG
jgi:hypothetical protein